MQRYPDSSEYNFEAVRSRGPGGQNVNRTNSAAILRWHLPSTELPTPIKERLLQKLERQMTANGDILIRSETSRDLDQNRKTCIEKLHHMIDQALFVQKKRVKTKPKYSAVKKRIEGKKHRGEIKRGRSDKGWDD